MSPGGGLFQLVALGINDVYLSYNPKISYFKAKYKRHTTTGMEYDSFYDTCFSTMSKRTYDNFEIIFDDYKLGKEYHSNNLITIYPISLSKFKNKSILVNSKKIIMINKEKLNSIIKKENKLKAEEEQMKKEGKKEEKRHHDDTIKFFDLNYGLFDASERAQRKAQNKQIKNQMKNQIKNQMKRR